MRRCRLAACFVFAYVFTGYSSPVGIGKAWPYGSVSVSRLARLYALRGHRFGFVYQAMNHLKVKCLSRAWELLNAFHRIFSIRHKSVSRLPNALRSHNPTTSVATGWSTLQNRLIYAELFAGGCARLLRVALWVVSAVVSNIIAVGR